MRLLVHACCAPCLSGVHPALAGEHEAVPYWYNPAIHPYREWRERLHGLQRYSYLTGLDTIYDAEYSLAPHLGAMASLDAAGMERCRYCYAVRLRRTAERALELGFDGFTSTLLVSPHQRHDAIREIGTSIGRDLGIEFLYLDLRPHWKDSIARSREYELYRQPYCGCIFSELERFGKDSPTRK